MIDEDTSPPSGGEFSPAGSYDDVLEAGVHVFLAVPLLAPQQVTTPPARDVLATPEHVTRQLATRPRSAQHGRPRHSVAIEALLLGVTAAVVVLAGVVVLLSLVDWLS